MLPTYDPERLLSMSAFEAAFILRRFRVLNPTYQDEQLIESIRSVRADFYPNDYDAGLTLERFIPEELDGTSDVAYFKAAIQGLIDTHQPLWVRLAPGGRERVLQAVSVNGSQCFRNAGLLETPPGQEVSDWWDALAARVRNERDARLLNRGREAERRSLAADGARLIQPHFAPLGSSAPGPTLIFLEDTSLLAERVQQSKLAALGRLSASIAHEIRNPVGAMSHAGQLLAESPNMSPGDKRLTDIIRNNSERVSGIINNVLQLSRRESSRPSRLSLGDWLREFLAEFSETMQVPLSEIGVHAEAGDLEVRFDASHLHQVVWNLCDNAAKYGEPSGGLKAVIRVGRLTPSYRPYLEVADRGAGIEPQAADRIFEPFFTGRKGGTGLGLFIARELCQLNRAILLYEPRAGGGSLFRVVFSDPQRWEE